MATPAQTSANSTGCSLTKPPTISVRTPSQSPRRVTPARRVFYHMAPPGAPFQPQAAASSVVVGRASSSGDSVPTSSGWAVRTCRCALEELLLVLPPEDVAAAAVDHSGDIESH